MGFASILHVLAKNMVIRHSLKLFTIKPCIHIKGENHFVLFVS